MFNEKKLLSDLQALPPDKQLEVADFVAGLKSRAVKKGPVKSLAGLWKEDDHNLDLETIQQNRKEMFKHFIW